MRQFDLTPNLGTLNGVLEAISSLGAWRRREECALSTLSEFHQIGIEPSLGTYYLLLNISYKESQYRS
jgi:pentatricopeptide repeat domain-containing protein 3